MLGVLPGVVGLIQATEALKVLLGRGRTLQGRLLAYDALDMAFREYRVKRDPNCAVCGDHPSIQQPEDLVWACAASGPVAPEVNSGAKAPEGSRRYAAPPPDPQGPT